MCVYFYMRSKLGRARSCLRIAWCLYRSVDGLGERTSGTPECWDVDQMLSQMSYYGFQERDVSNPSHLTSSSKPRLNPWVIGSHLAHPGEHYYLTEIFHSKECLILILALLSLRKHCRLVFKTLVEELSWLHQTRGCLFSSYASLAHIVF